MEVSATPRETLIVHAPASAFAPGVRSALTALRYKLVTPSEAEPLEDETGPMRAALRIVDDRELEQVPLETGPRPRPLVLLTRHRGPPTTDARAVGIVRRRARLQPLYELIQRATEAHPRCVPRAPTDLPFRAVRGERFWAGAIRSLSEKGCRVLGTRGLEPDLRVELTFPIPGGGMVNVPAQPLAIREDHAILVFRGSFGTTREAIAGYVAERLSTLQR
jgi:hypothetical protein